jgi:hypothetical protein
MDGIAFMIMKLLSSIAIETEKIQTKKENENMHLPIDRYLFHLHFM